MINSVLHGMLFVKLFKTHIIQEQPHYSVEMKRGIQTPKNIFCSEIFISFFVFFPTDTNSQKAAWRKCPSLLENELVIYSHKAM